MNFGCLSQAHPLGRATRVAALRLGGIVPDSSLLTAIQIILKISVYVMISKEAYESC